MAIQTIKTMEIENKEEREFLLDVCEKTQLHLLRNWNIKLQKANAMLPIVREFLYNVITKLNDMKVEDGEVSINLFDILELGIAHQINEEDEGSGNFVPSLVASPVYKMLIKDDGKNKEDLDSEDEDDDE